MKNTIAIACLLNALASTSAFASSVEGTCLESWELPNFQPNSSTFHKRVASGAYADRATLFAFLASW